MPILTTPSGAFPISLVYITAGVLIDIWCGVAFWFYPPQSNSGYFWLTGFFATGAALLVIGMLLGSIGRAAKRAELPPPDVTPEVAQAEQTAAANPPPVVPTLQGTPTPVAPPNHPGAPPPRFQ